MSPAGDNGEPSAAPVGAGRSAADTQASAAGEAGAAVEAGAVEVAIRSRPVRWAWLGVGWVAVGLGSVGVVVPGLPTTGFFVLAASCFAKSSPRFERWVLDLPGVGPLVRDYRAGLGMPRRAKAVAIATMVAVAAVSAVLSANRPVVGGATVALVLVGIWYVAARVPTRERVLAERGLLATRRG